MKENILDIESKMPIYTLKTIVVSALFASLLASIYMIYQNFKSHGQTKKPVPAYCSPHYVLSF